MSNHLHENSWLTIKEELKLEDTVIIPLGSLEAHGPQNPIGNCYLITQAALKDVGEKIRILTLPIIPFGIADPYENFPGSITVSSEALFKYLWDVCESLVNSGFKKIIFFSGHGGDNLFVYKKISLKLRKKYGTLCAILHLWGIIGQLTTPDFIKPEFKGHGGEMTTSVIQYLFPYLVDMKKIVWKPPKQPLQGFQTKSHSLHLFNNVQIEIPLFTEEVTSDGLLADPRGASKEKGKILYNKLIDYLVEFIHTFKKINP